MDHTVSLAVRSIVGLLISFIAGFLGMIVENYLIPPIGKSDFMALFWGVLIIALFAMTGAAFTWFNFLLDRRKTAFLLLASLTGGIVSGIIAYYWSENTTAGSDPYIQIREITQSTVLGVAVGTNLLPLVIGIVAPRTWRA
jgi:hypothetical protein